MAKIMFEKFNVKSFYVATEAVLSLFSSGVTSGIAVECGEEVVRSLPVFEGFALRHAFSSTRVASRNIYAHFGKGLQVRAPSSPHGVHISCISLLVVLKARIRPTDSDCCVTVCCPASPSTGARRRIRSINLWWTCSISRVLSTSSRKSMLAWISTGHRLSESPAMNSPMSCRTVPSFMCVSNSSSNNNGSSSSNNNKQQQQQQRRCTFAWDTGIYFL